MSGLEKEVWASWKGCEKKSTYETAGNVMD